MRLTRTLAMAAAAVAVIAAWPQDLTLPAVDHSQHPMVEAPLDLPHPSLTVRLFPDRMDGFNVLLETRNFRFTPENAGGPNIANEGHAHLYVNGAKVARMYSPWHHLTGNLLREGINRIEVEFSTNDHSVWSVAGSPIGADVLIDTRAKSEDPIVREEVRYSLDWSWGAAAPRPGGGWEVRNDLGYLVAVESGRLVTRNLELVPCHVMPAQKPAAALLRRLGPIRAEAGHSSLVPNESKISASYEENLAEPARAFVEARTVTDPEYCRAHYLIARARGTGPGSPALEISGTWSRSDAPGPTPFQVETSGAYGQFVEFRASDGTALASRSIVGGMEVSVSRSLSTMFDGIDFARSAPDGMQIMRRLVADTKAVVRGS